MELLLDSRILNSGLMWGAAVLSSIAVSACTPSTLNLSSSETLNQGYVIDEQQLELVPVGSSREQVILALGSPSTKAIFDNEVYYYISQTRKRSMAFQKPHLVDQRVLAVYFGEDGRVTNIANYGKKDGKVFDFISRTTPTSGKDQTFIGQILGGVSGLPSLPGGNAPR
ncbi:MAG: outer membrane protein assembly factor BamE [Rhizobiaceae bacterium]|nr:outer membrane protein assembly factor BamE [Rhizobiaceae bacterium]